MAFEQSRLTTCEVFRQAEILFGAEAFAVFSTTGAIICIHCALSFLMRSKYILIRCDIPRNGFTLVYTRGRDREVSVSFATNIYRSRTDIDILPDYFAIADKSKRRSSHPIGIVWDTTVLLRFASCVCPKLLQSHGFLIRSKGAGL